jgi:hypothetical protein
MRVVRDSVAQRRTITGSSRRAAAHARAQVIIQLSKVRVPAPGALLTRSYYHSESGTSMTGPIPLPKQYPAHLQLCYRGVKYRPAALQLFVQRGGWGPEYIPTTKPPVKAALKAPVFSLEP